MAHIKDSRSYHFTHVGKRADHALLFATVIAVLAHAGLIFGVSFGSESSPAAIVQEVTTVLTENVQKNEQADFIANADQQGGGESDEKKRFENADMSPLDADKVNPTDDIVSQERKVQQQAYQENYLRTTLSWEKINEKNDNKKDNKNNDLEAQEQRIQQQIATLETQIGTQRQLLAKKSAVKTIDSNSTTKSNEATYIENFRQQAYRIGNQQYPQEARAKGLKGDVRLMVIIDPTGTVKAIKLLESSGYPVLDEAAKESVRKAAPFGAFDKDMKDISELRIIRTWRFGDELAIEKEFDTPIDGQATEPPPTE